MRIVDFFTTKNGVFAYCIDENISDNYDCQAISAKGEEIAVRAYEILTSMGGSKSIVLQLDVGKENKNWLGEVKIIR